MGSPEPPEVGMSSIKIIGDSHALTFGRLADVDIRHVGPVTMHRIGRDGAAFLLDGLHLEAGDVVVFVFGEIDVRAHVGRIADSTRVARSEILSRLVDTYIGSLASEQSAHPSCLFVVASVPPPAGNNAGQNESFPFYGSHRSRIALTRRLNRLLRAAAGMHALPFLHYGHAFAGPMGGLRWSMSDGHVHIAKEHGHLIAAPLARLLKREIKVLPLSETTLGFSATRRSYVRHVFRRLKRRLRPKRRA